MLEVLVASVSTIDTKLLSPNHLSSGVPLSTLAFQLCKYIATYDCWSLTFVACLFVFCFFFCFRFFLVVQVLLSSQMKNISFLAICYFHFFFSSFLIIFFLS